MNCPTCGSHNIVYVEFQTNYYAVWGMIEDEGTRFLSVAENAHDSSWSGDDGYIRCQDCGNRIDETWDEVDFSAGEA